VTPVVVRKELRDQRRALIGWGGGLVAMVALYGSFWPSIRDNAEQFESYMESLPEALQSWIGELSIATPVGYLQGELFTFLGPALMLVFAIGAGARSVAGEEEQGTMDLLAATPATRGRIVVEKFTAMTLTALGIGLVLWLAIVTLGPLFDLTVPVDRVAAATLMLVMLGVAFGAIAMFLGCWLGRRGLAIGISAGLAVALYLVNALAPAVDGLEWAAKLSPFYYYDQGPPLAEGLDPVNALVLAAIAAAAAIGSVLAFDRRDIHT
jgi:ABC-2 type transport system permease protein